MRSSGPVFPLRTWLMASHLAAFVVPVAVLFGTGVWRSDLRDQTRWDIENQATIIGLHVESLLEHEGDPSLSTHAEDVSALLSEVKATTLAGVRLTDRSARVVASSGDGVGEDLSADPEVAAALEGRVAASVRPRGSGERQPLSSPSRRANVRLFVARPIWFDGEVAGAVVISRTPREELQALYQMTDLRLLIGVTLALVTTLGASFAASVVLSRSLRRLEAGAREVATGSLAGLPELEARTDSHVLEVAHLAETVATMATRLERRIAYIGEFASNVSHEFKTPLATLRGTVELLDDDPDMPGEQRRRFLENAQRELTRLDRLVGGLLSLARADAPPADDVVDLDALVRTAALAKGAAIDGVFGVVRGDRSQLDAVLVNLLDNAFQHGGPEVRVRVAPVHPAGFAVMDDGQGISASNQAKVFDRFFTTDRARGTGLGLALARAIIERHGGQLTLQSKPGETIFRVTLPSAEPALPVG